MSARRKPREPGNFHPLGSVDRIPVALLHPEERAALEATFGPINRLVDDSLQVSLPQVRYAWDMREAWEDLTRVQAHGSEDEHAKAVDSWRAGVAYTLGARLLQEIAPGGDHTLNADYRRASFAKGAAVGRALPLRFLVPRLGALRGRLQSLSPSEKPHYIYRNGRWSVATPRDAA